MIEMETVKFDISTKQKPFVIVGIPAFNEEQTIARIILEANKFADKVIVCDDGSSDYTADIAKGLGAYVVRHETNVGYGAALQSLFKSARLLNADVFITIDGDGQHDPEEIPRLIRPIAEGLCDVVVGSRFIDKNGTVEMPKYRQLGVKVITKLVNGSAKNGVSDAQSGFRAYSDRAIECLTLSEMGMGASIELLLELKKFGLKFCEVPISCKYKDTAGVKTSTEHPFLHGIGLISSIIKLVVEEKPLVYLGMPGIICMFFGIFFGGWMLDIYAIEHRIVTNIALASASSIFIAFFLLSSAITLFSISKVSKKIGAT